MAEAARPLVIVTRPREESEVLAPRLEALGYGALVEPMLDIVPRRIKIPPLDKYAALAFTSANGVRAFANLSPIRDLPSYAVGPATAAALRRAGFADIRSGSTDGLGLAALVARQQPHGANLLHAGGMAVARDLGPLLTPHGIGVERLEFYEAIPIKQFSQALVEALYACTVGFVLLFSARTAETFGTVAARMTLTETCCPIAALCLSRAVAEKAAVLPWARVAVAAKPTEDAMLELLPARRIDG